MAFPPLSEVVNDPELAESFTIQRSIAVFARGGVQTQVSAIPSYGIIDNAQGQDMDQIPEGDRVTGMIVIHTEAQIYLTQVDPATEVSYISDIVQWHNLDWRVMHVTDKSNRGFYSALAVRMSGT